MASHVPDARTTEDAELSGIILVVLIVAVNALLVWLCM